MKAVLITIFIMLDLTLGLMMKAQDTIQFNKSEHHRPIRKINNSENDSTISGIVTDYLDLNTIPFVTILVKDENGKLIGKTQTDFDGKFNIKFSPDSTGTVSIIAKFVGYRSLVVTKIPRKSVTLKMELKDPDDIVMTIPGDMCNCDAKHDIKGKHLKIFLLGGKRGFTKSITDTLFERKYQINYFNRGGNSSASYNPELDYNRAIFKYLDRTYGEAWRKDVRQDADDLAFYFASEMKAQDTIDKKKTLCDSLTKKADYIFEGKTISSQSYRIKTGTYTYANYTSHLVEVQMIVRGDLQKGNVEIIEDADGMIEEKDGMRTDVQNFDKWEMPKSAIYFCFEAENSLIVADTVRANIKSLKIYDAIPLKNGEFGTDPLNDFVLNFSNKKTFYEYLKSNYPIRNK